MYYSVNNSKYSKLNKLYIYIYNFQKSSLIIITNYYILKLNYN